jgi:hypothetical protein
MYKTIPSLIIKTIPYHMSFKGMHLLGSGIFNIIKNYLVGIEKIIRLQPLPDRHQVKTRARSSGSKKLV